LIHAPERQPQAAMTQPESPSARQAPLAVAAVTPRPAATTLNPRDGALGLEVLMFRRST
jgi:hypothetical protein